MRTQLLTELREQIDDYIAEPDSEAGQAEIHENGRSHVLEVWEDGELTSTKNGELYTHRSLHQSHEPWLPANQHLFEVPEDREHKRMIVTNRDALLDAFENYAEEHGMTFRRRR